MIVIRVLLNVQVDNHSAFKTVMQEDVKATLDFEGCVRFDVFQQINDEDTFMLYEEWETLDHFEVYRRSDYFKRIGEKIFPLVAGQPDSAYYQADVVTV